MKIMAGLTTILLLFAIVIFATYFGTQKYAEHQQKKQTMAFLGVNVEGK